MKVWILRMSCLMIFAVVGDTASANLVFNGGFETGNFSGWALAGGDLSDNYVGSNAFVHGGRYAAYFGEEGDMGTMSQSLTTTIGTSYNLSFWFAGSNDIPSEFTASIGGSLLLDLVNPREYGNQPPFTQYTYSFVASDSSTLLSFGFRDDANFITLDDVSVVAASSVPEPSSLALLGIGGAGLLGLDLARRRRRTAMVPTRSGVRPSS